MAPPLSTSPSFPLYSDRETASTSSIVDSPHRVPSTGSLSNASTATTPDFCLSSIPQVATMPQRRLVRGPFTKTIHPIANLSAGGSPADVVDTISDLDILPDGSRMPTTKEVLACIPAHCKKPCNFRSSVAILRDLLLVAICAYITLKVVSVIGGIHSHIDLTIWLIYMVVQGTISTGVWVIGHECGHGAFSPSPLLNDVVGYIVHTSLLVPYFSWKYSHNKHHNFTNHLTWGESHVPSLLSEAGKGFKFIRTLLCDDAFAAYECVAHLILGWPAYMAGNVTGGRRSWDGAGLDTFDGKARIDEIDREMREDRLKGAKGERRKEICASQYISEPSEVELEIENSVYAITDCKRMNHFVGEDSLLYPPEIQKLVTLSGAGCLCVVLGLAFWGLHYGWGTVFRWYVLPWLVVNMQVVVVTWMHHTHPNIPHYGDKSFTWLRGALSTIDRPYPWILDELHHHIGTTHVLHHIDSKIPHYHAQEATRAMREALGPLYRVDNTSFLKSIWIAAKTCHYVDDFTSVQYFKSLMDFASLLDGDKGPATTEEEVKAHVPLTFNAVSTSFASPSCIVSRQSVVKDSSVSDVVPAAVVGQLFRAA